MLENRRELIRQMPKHFQVGVEIGVREGKYSKFMLENSNMTIYSVDPWENNCELSHAPQVYQYCKNLLAPFGERSKMLKMTSFEASKMFEDESVDFVYIDGLHDYDSVKLDIESWWPKVKKGGICAGHDFNPVDWEGVFMAAMNFFIPKFKLIHVCKQNQAEWYHNNPNEEYDGRQPSWVVEK